VSLVRKLMDSLSRLGYDVEIAVRLSGRQTGRLSVAVG